MKCFSVVALCVSLPAIATAQEFPVQQVRDLRLPTIQRAIQCELGVFAKRIRYQSLDAKHNKAGYSVTAKVANSGGWGVDLGIFNWIKFGYHDNNTATNDLAVTFRPRNIHPDNAKACSRRADALVLADLRSCLAQVAAVSDDVDNWRCGSQINVKRDLSAGATIPIYAVSFGPSGSYGTEYSQGIRVAVPPAGIRD